MAVPGLLIFAAFGLLLLWQRLASGELASRRGLSRLLIVGSTIFVAWPQHDPSLWALDAYNSGWQALESNNLPLAEKKLALAYAYVPGNAETNFALGNLRLAEDNVSTRKHFIAPCSQSIRNTKARSTIWAWSLWKISAGAMRNRFSRGPETGTAQSKDPLLAGKGAIEAR